MEDTELQLRYPNFFSYSQDQGFMLDPNKNFLAIVVHEKDEETLWEELRIMMAPIKRRMSLEYLIVRPEEVGLLEKLCYLGVENIIVLMTPRTAEHHIDLYEMKERVQTKPCLIPVRMNECEFFGTKLGRIMSLPRGGGKFASGWYSAMQSGESDRFLLLVAQGIVSLFSPVEEA